MQALEISRTRRLSERPGMDIMGSFRVCATTTTRLRPQVVMQRRNGGATELGQYKCHLRQGAETSDEGEESGLEAARRWATSRQRLPSCTAMFVVWWVIRLGQDSTRM